ncbi:NEDD4-binding protein 2 [Betta splendens]|uniref:NEDD4-binding protein 2 n=1 Tax=Betta splendens TaxID=158456 RepID=A0A6P7MNA3_BETSP|nr:NEDD4-binding protein 2 [Betta splendens]
MTVNNHGMPRRKKPGQSPARGDGGGGNRPPHAHPDAMASNFPSGDTLSSSDKDKIVKNMQEMFSHLDSEVLYIVLSECDFKVENAMDALLELSVAAETAAPVPSVSGFERTAAALLSPHHFSESRPRPDASKPSQQLPSPPSTKSLADELDLVVDKELEGLTAQQLHKDEHLSNQDLSSGVSFSPPCLQQTLPELLQSSLEAKSKGPSAEQTGQVVSQLEHITETNSSLDQLRQDRQEPALDLAASGRPSAFQVYKKQEPPHCHSEWDVVTGARSKMNTLNQEPLGNISSAWNLEAPVFSPRIHGNQSPAFITPVAQPPSVWFSKPLHLNPVYQAPLKPLAPIPKSWAVPGAVKHSDKNSRLRLEGKLLVLLRGAPGSGKSSLARALLEDNQGGIILSTDDYFTQNGQYRFDPTFLGEAHEWNHKRAKEAFERGTNPIIIDNTNMQGWEMRPYVVQALTHGYKVLFREPDTWWKNKPRELERRTSHNVPVETIRRMLDGYERFVTVQNIMDSQMPEHKHRLLLDNRSSKPKSSGTPCPDLVEQPELMEGFKKSRSQLFSSLPDVSSIGCPAELVTLGDSTHKSTKALSLPDDGEPTENTEFSDGDDYMDLGDLDSELDAHLQMDHSLGSQRIPDCIVESVMNEDRHGDEMPVAFAESIGQRVKRQRPSRRSEFTDLVKDTNQLECEANEERKNEEAEEVVLMSDEPENRMPEMLDFVGDWPQASREQRQLRRKERHTESNLEEVEGVSLETNETKVQSDSPFTEFLKIADVMQTGAAVIQARASHSSSPSQSCGGESEKEEQADSSFEESSGSGLSSEERPHTLNHFNSSSSSDLPDCVLDWKSPVCPADEKATVNNAKGLPIENETIDSTGGHVQETEAAIETEAVDLTSTNKTCLSTAVRGGGHTDICANEYTDNVRERGPEVGSHVREECHSPVCESSMEADVSGGSQEKKQRQGRRPGKHCKLALTFTQNCPASSSDMLENPFTTVQNTDSCGIPNKTDVEPNLNPTCNSSVKLEPNVDLCKESVSEADLQPCSLVDTGCFTQTEPQDFALLWRLNHQDHPDNIVIHDSSHVSDFKVLSGDSSRFVPELSTATLPADTVHPSFHKEVPYRVVHERGTQVEEKDFGVNQDRSESLSILSQHFKLVAFDTLEDLYDKCHQDLEWTTNLLLDSGERFSRDEDGDGSEDELNASSVYGTLDKTIQSSECAKGFNESSSEDLHKAGTTGSEQDIPQLTCGKVGESDVSSSNHNVLCSDGVADPVRNKEHLDTTSELVNTPQVELNQPRATKEGEHTLRPEPKLDDEAWCGSLDDAVIIEETRVENEDEIASMDEVERLLQAELDEMEREAKQRREERRSKHLDIQSLELKLPTELALQLAELFGPVGVDPGTCSTDDYAVKMDLNLAKLLHHKWKETIQERQNQAALSFRLLKEGSTHWGESQWDKPGPTEQTWASHDLQPDPRVQMPFMDHWNVSHSHVSLRDIIKEEQALQNMAKTRQSRADQRDGASQFKENQLYSSFPTIDRHFLQDIFRDHNYSLTKTELFLHSLLDEEPVKTVVAPETPRSHQHRPASKEREKWQKHLESAALHYQDTEDPEYEDFRAEAGLQRSRQLESFSKAAEAYKQGRKEVASFYAQQGHLHGERMHEANHRAAVQIFQRVNSSLLPNNILDLHGLHVNEALEHLTQVLQDKTSDCEQGLCRPQLSVITGRGNHSQGGVARIRPAVIEYLTSKQYRFTEPKPGLVLVSLR